MLYSSLEMENEDINSLATSDVVGISHDVLGLGFGYRFPDLGTFFPPHVFVCGWGDVLGENEISSECVLLSQTCSHHGAHVETRGNLSEVQSLPY